MKKEVIGIRCELASQKEAYDDEIAISLSNRIVFIKNDLISFLKNPEKYAVIGESPVFIKKKAILRLTGPCTNRDFLIGINSRGYLEEFFVKEEDVLFYQ